MPQNATQVLVGLTESKQPTPLATTDDKVLKITPVPSEQAISIANATGTIASTGTFQAAIVANADRLPGGAIANNGTKTMQISFTAYGDANADKSIPLAIGNTLALATILGPDNIYTGEISITGTATDKFATVEISKA